MIPHLTHSSSPSDQRMILEFRGEQTLLDFHRALVELSWDSFCDDAFQEKGDDENTKERSGMIVNEENLFTVGKVDYSGPILEWLKEDSKRKSHVLGIDDGEDVSVQAMNDIRLEEIPMRLGIRYMHVHSGNVKSQIFLIDRRHGYPRQPTIARSYPIIHDLWASGWPAPDCEACRRRVSMFATSLACEVTDGHKALCQVCADELQVPAEHRQRYDVWKISGTPAK